MSGSGVWLMAGSYSLVAATPRCVPPRLTTSWFCPDPVTAIRLHRVPESNRPAASVAFLNDLHF